MGVLGGHYLRHRRLLLHARQLSPVLCRGGFALLGRDRGLLHGGSHTHAFLCQSHLGFFQGVLQGGVLLRAGVKTGGGGEQAGWAHVAGARCHGGVHARPRVFRLHVGKRRAVGAAGEV